VCGGQEALGLVDNHTFERGDGITVDPENLRKSGRRRSPSHWRVIENSVLKKVSMKERVQVENDGKLNGETKTEKFTRCCTQAWRSELTRELKSTLEPSAAGRAGRHRHSNNLRTHFQGVGGM